MRTKILFLLTIFVAGLAYFQSIDGYQIVYAGTVQTKLIDQYSDNMAKYSEADLYLGRFIQMANQVGECKDFSISLGTSLEIVSAGKASAQIKVDNEVIDLLASNPSNFDMYYYVGKNDGVSYELAVASQIGQNIHSDRAVLLLADGMNNCTATFSRTATFNLAAVTIK